MFPPGTDLSGRGFGVALAAVLGGCTGFRSTLNPTPTSTARPDSDDGGLSDGGDDYPDGRDG